MDSFFSRYRNPLVLIAVVLAQVLALAMQVQRPAQGFGTDTPDSKENTLARRWVTATVTPSRCRDSSSAVPRNGQSSGSMKSRPIACPTRTRRPLGTSAR